MPLEKNCVFTQRLGPLTIESVGVRLQIGANIANSPFEGIAELRNGQTCLIIHPLTVWTSVIIIINSGDGGCFQRIVTHAEYVHYQKDGEGQAELPPKRTRVHFPAYLHLRAIAGTDMASHH